MKLVNDKGMSIVELLVASTLSMLIFGMGLSATIACRNSYSYDILRTRLNQNIRSAFDIINSELRQSGERLPSAFPALEIIDGGTNASDQLILKRNLLDEILTVCQNITPSTVGGYVYITSTAVGTPPACTYGTQTSNYNAWKAYRLADPTTVVKAYIYDFVSKKGEFFNYNSETNNGTTIQGIHRQSGTWANSYTATSSSVYILSEWNFAKSTVSGQTDLLKLTQNKDTANPQSIIYGINDIQFKAIMQDNTIKTSFATTDSWTLLKAIEVSITGTDSYRGRTITSTLTTRLFPRNVLSN